LKSQFPTGPPRRLPRNNRDAAAHSNDQLTDDGQAQTRTPGVATSSVIEPGEALEDPLRVLRCYARAVVTDADHGPTLINSGCYFHLRSRVPHRIVNQVPHRPTQLVGIDHDHHRLVRDPRSWNSSSLVGPR